MKWLLILLLFFGFCYASDAQKYMTKNGYIGFYSHTPIEDIKADNNQVASVIDMSTGEIVFQVLIKSFHFAKALMEEHFNENYLESEKFPRSVFKGNISNFSGTDFTKNGKYEVTVDGDLTIHDVTHRISAKGTIEVTSAGINADSRFILAPEDYNIKIPSVVRENIAKTVEVSVIMKYVPLANQ